ncbi:MAG: hypothetical protein WCI01_12050 [Chlorobiaceae bacterium]
MSTTAQIFMQGKSQMLMLPSKLRVQAKEMRVEQIGNDLWLHPEIPAEQNMGKWLCQFYASTEALPVDFLASRHDEPAQKRDWT